MGQRGPAPKPIEVRRIEGTYKASKHGQPIVVAGKALELEAPAHLPDAFTAIWDELVPSLTDAGLVDRVDALALEALVTCVVTWRDAQRMIDAEGSVAWSEKGSPYMHPAVGIRNSAMRDFRSWCREFGMTPSSRVGLGIQALRGKTMAADLSERIGPSPRRST